ncbi:hypothetical protein WMY93_006767 [Mugilogobius chulae]|uniref:C2H2-type domain-containing protein n=1 Tax=Mugilogobius chulae TaxID=88201 RepID=A0AAW0PNC8_9GOBI
MYPWLGNPVLHTDRSERERVFAAFLNVSNFPDSTASSSSRRCPVQAGLRAECHYVTGEKCRIGRRRRRPKRLLQAGASTLQHAAAADRKLVQRSVEQKRDLTAAQTVGGALSGSQTYGSTGVFTLKLNLTAVQTTFQLFSLRQEVSNKHNLKQHLEVQSRARPYSCSDCGRSFKSNSLLHSHMFVHTEEKPYSCSSVGGASGGGLSCRSTRSLTLERKHTDQQPFRCSVCDKSFKHEKNLHIHRSVHSDRAHNCSVCGKRFGNETRLTKHMSVHSEQRTYSCSDCDRTFKWKSYSTN